MQFIPSDDDVLPADQISDVETSAVVSGARNIAGLPKYDEAANISMKQLWPAMVIIAGENFSIKTSHQSQVSTQDSMVSGCISTLSETWTWTITSGRNKIKIKS